MTSGEKTYRYNLDIRAETMGTVNIRVREDMTPEKFETLIQRLKGLLQEISSEVKVSAYITKEL